MTDLAYADAWSAGYRAAGVIAFGAGCLIGWLLRSWWRRRPRTMAYFMPLPEGIRPDAWPGTHYELKGRVTKSRPPTKEEAAQGVRDVIEGVDLESVSVVPNSKFLCDSWRLDGSGCTKQKKGPCGPMCPGWSRSGSP